VWKTNKLEALLDQKSESRSVTKPVSPTSEMANMSLQEHSLAITRTITEITQKRANVSQLVAFLLCHSGSMCPWHVAIIKPRGLSTDLVNPRETVHQTCQPISAGRNREPTTGLAIDFKICLSNSCTAALHRLSILCFGACLPLSC